MNRRKIITIAVSLIIGFTMCFECSNNTYAESNYIKIPSKCIAGKTVNIKICGINQDLIINGEEAEEGEVGYVADSGYFDDYKYVEANTDTKIVKFKTDEPYRHKIEVYFDKYIFQNGIWHEQSGDDGIDKTAYFDVMGTLKFNTVKGKPKIKKRYYKENAKYGKLPKVKRKTYKFLGWFTKKKKGKKISRTSKVHFSEWPSKTIYAHWKRISKRCKVRFYGNKGKVTKKRKTVWTGKKFGKLPKPKRKNYLFTGWYTKKHGGKKIKSYSKVPYKSRVKLYAHWFGPKGRGSRCTWSQYWRVDIGMSYFRAEYLLGGEGELIYSYTDSNYNFYDTYEWKGNKRNSYVLLHFKNDRVTDMSQYGL